MITNSMLSKTFFENDKYFDSDLYSMKTLHTFEATLP